MTKLHIKENICKHLIDAQKPTSNGETNLSIKYTKGEPKIISTTEHKASSVSKTAQN